jgi:hypothetical protein
MHTDKGGKKQTAETQRVQRNAEEEPKLLMAKSSKKFNRRDRREHRAAEPQPKEFNHG